MCLEVSQVHVNAEGDSYNDLNYLALPFISFCLVGDNDQRRGKYLVPHLC